MKAANLYLVAQANPKEGWEPILVCHSVTDGLSRNLCLTALAGHEELLTSTARHNYLTHLLNGDV